MQLKCHGGVSVVAALATSALVVGCAGAEEAPCELSTLVAYVPAGTAPDVDLLLMIDDSSSTAEVQASLATELPRVIQVLAAGNLHPEDGVTIGSDFEPVQSLQVGIVSSDMGSGGFTVPTCAEPRFGEDGVLLHRGNTAAGCMATYPTAFLGYDPSAPGADPTTFARDVSCIAVLGTGGCGFEQPLEAILKALTPSTQPATGAFDGSFAMGTPGHGDGVNAGFARVGSVLAIVALTDEDDCSASDPELFDPASARYPVDLNLRCFEYEADALHPVARYVDGLLARTTNPRRLVFAAIAGVPEDLAPPPGVRADYDAILADPRMSVRIDPALPTRTLPSCSERGYPQAYPPARIVRLAAELDARGAHATVQSLCRLDFAQAIDAVLAEIADSLPADCLGRALQPDPSGRVDCEVLEELPTSGAATTCAALPGRERVGTSAETGAEICRIAQVPATGGVVPSAPGWHYDDFSDHVRERCVPASRIAWSGGAEPSVGARVRLECESAATGEVDAGGDCS